MAKKSKNAPSDINQLAHFIVGRTTEDPAASKPTEKELRSQIAKMLGSLGGKKGGPARAKVLSAKRRREIAKAAVDARWAKTKKK